MASAQMLAFPQYALDGTYAFNADWIKGKGIAQITIAHSFKPSSKPIRDKGRRTVLQFDTAGRLIEKQEITVIGRLGADTSTTTILYGTNNLPEIQWTLFGNYRKKEEFGYFPNGTLAWYSWSSQAGNGEQQLVQQEFYQYDTLGKYIVVTVMNDERLPFATRKREIKNGEVVSETVSFRHGGNRREWEIHRAPADTVVVRKPGAEKHFGFADNLLLTEDDYNNGIHTAHAEWLYVSNGLPKARLRKNISTEDIEIDQFAFLFYTVGRKK